MDEALDGKSGRIVAHFSENRTDNRRDRRSIQAGAPPGHPHLPSGCPPCPAPPAAAPPRWGAPAAGELSAWQCMKFGAGPVPIETSEGWLLFYHGVLRSCNGYVYAFGSALLDRDEPWKVLEYCASQGDIYDIVVENMERQENGLPG